MVHVLGVGMVTCHTNSCVLQYESLRRRIFKRFENKTHKIYTTLVKVLGYVGQRYHIVDMSHIIPMCMYVYIPMVCVTFQVD